MAKIAAQRHRVAHQLLQFLHLGKAPFLPPGPDQLVVNTHLENAPRRVGNERDRTKLLGECGQEFLARPASPEQPAAKPTISDGNIRRRGDDVVTNFV